MLNLSPDRKGIYDEIQRLWMQLMRAGRDPTLADPWDRSIFLPVRPLEQRHLRRCRMLTSREALLHRLKKGAVCGEIGTLRGEFAAAIARICQPRELHIFDLTLRHFRAAGHLRESGTVILHEGDSSTRLKTFPDRYFDWLYVDGDHTYEGVRRDIEVGVEKIKPDGMLVFNDYTFWSPVELVPYGIIHAVNELCLDRDFEILYFALEERMYCDVALRRRAATSLLSRWLAR